MNITGFLSLPTEIRLTMAWHGLLTTDPDTGNVTYNPARAAARFRSMARQIEESIPTIGAELVEVPVGEFEKAANATYDAVMAKLPRKATGKIRRRKGR